MRARPQWTAEPVFASFAVITVAVAAVVNAIVPEPYMDEIFHIPQTQQYCRGDLLTWHPMITTFPGLYFLALAYARIAQPFVRLISPSTQLLDTCSVPFLRSLNILLLLSFPLFLSTARVIAHATCDAPVKGLSQPGNVNDPHSKHCDASTHTPSPLTVSPVKTQPATCCNDSASSIGEDEDADDEDCVGRAVLFAVFPLHLFFGFLFYTDVASTVAVLALLNCCYTQRLWLAGLAAAAAVSIRQTNAVWVLFSSAVAAMHFLNVGVSSNPSSQPTPQVNSHRKQDSMSSQCPPTRRLTPSTKTLPHSAMKNSVAEPSRDPSWATPAVIAGESVPLSFLLLLLRVWQRLGSFLGSFLPLISVVVGFAAFVVTNGGIVVGDRSQHRMSLHLMQPLYCVATVTLSLLPLIFHPSSLRSVMHSLASSLRKSPLRVLLWAAPTLFAIFFAIKDYSIAHPYLLADNRHFTFYLWRRLISPASLPALRFAWLPLYALSLTALWHALAPQVSSLWLFFFAASTLLVLVPAPLLEPRYFLIPFVVTLLHIRLPRTHRLATVLCTIGVYSLLNVTAFYLFLFRPFKWAGHEGWQRFMW